MNNHGSSIYSSAQYHRSAQFDRYVLLTTKQTRGESIEHFFGKLKELSENCELGSQEDTLIRDLFIASMLDPEIQREFLRETLEPSQALRLAINMELGQRNQLQITNSQSAPQVNAVIPQRSFRPPNQRLHLVLLDHQINSAETVV